MGRRIFAIPGDNPTIQARNSTLSSEKISCSGKRPWELTPLVSSIAVQTVESPETRRSREAKEKLFDSASRGTPKNQLRFVKSLTSKHAHELLQSKTQFDPLVKSALVAQSLKE